jgi:hypothetical protein
MKKIKELNQNNFIEFDRDKDDIWEMEKKNKTMKLPKGVAVIGENIDTDNYELKDGCIIIDADHMEKIKNGEGFVTIGENIEQDERKK